MIQLGGRTRVGSTILWGCLLAATWLVSTAAQQPGEWLCDDSYQDCRAPIISAINSEPVTGGIDVSLWFMDDWRYVDALIAARKRGVPIRMLVDLKADATYTDNKAQRDRLVAAGIPIRSYAGSAINHWKTFIFAGQRKMNFSAANFSNGSYSPIVPYTQYVDEAVYFTDDPAILNSFETKFDDRWTSATKFRDLANITGPLTRNYPTYAIDPSLNFVPDQNYENRLKTQVDLEGPNPNNPSLIPKIDVVMFRITSSKIPDALIARVQAGVPVRLINEEQQYRSTSYFWDSYNVDRMYMAGVQIKVKHNVTDQDVHQKSIILYTRALSIAPAPMVVFGSSNWTSASASGQEEHNYFTTKPWMVNWFIDEFERKWNNLTADGTPIGTTVFVPFKPLPPEAAISPSPANAALAVPTSVTLKWEGGWWAHKYDIYLDTTPTFTSPVVVDFMPGAATAGVVGTLESYAFTGLLPGTTYYWKIVSKTMANMTKSGPTWSFTTVGDVPAPPAPTGLRSTFASSTRIDVAWNDVAGEQGYKVERKPASTTTWTQIGITAQDVGTYSDVNSGLSPDTAYNYRVRAFTSGGNSGYSNVLNIRTGPATVTQSDVVLYAAKAPLVLGRWTVIADATAAGGQRIATADASAPTVTQPLANPTDYFEMTFSASAGVPYHLWIRGKASNDNGYNDSVYVQFSDSVTDASGATPFNQIGTTSGAMVNLQDCSGTCTVKGWGWQDNGFGTFGPHIYFATSGTHTVRVQMREDGFSIDQILLSSSTYLNAAPGAFKSDTIILPEQGSVTGPPDTQNPTVSITQPADGSSVAGLVNVAATASDDRGIARVELWVDGTSVQTDTTAPYSFDWDSRRVNGGPHTLEVHAYDAATNQAVSSVGVDVSNPPSDDIILFPSEAQSSAIVGNWSIIPDATAATGARMYEQNAGAAKVATAAASPANYFEMTFEAQAGVSYHLWMRLKAEINDWANDSVFVQFSNSVTAANAPIFQIGSTSATAINLEDCGGCGISGWGWQDNGWGVGVLGPDIYFSTSGTQTIRIQQREDGVSIDQIVLSSSTYLASSPGGLKADDTKLQR